MKRRFYFTLLVVAVILLALPGLTAKGVRRLTRVPRGARDLSIPQGG
jgi:hypothetical protein